MDKKNRYKRYYINELGKLVRFSCRLSKIFDEKYLIQKRTIKGKRKNISNGIAF